MSHLLDTSVISELRTSQRRADRAVRSWAAGREATALHLSSVSVVETKLGISRLRRRDDAQADRLQVWWEDDLLHVFDGRILPVDVAVARRAAWLHVPDPRPERDALGTP